MKIISLGMGMQSFALYLMSSTGAIERADHAVFADPGREHPETYALLSWLQLRWKPKHWIPFHYESSTLYEDLLQKKEGRFASIPAFTETDGRTGMLRRQCTREYKIDVVYQKVRDLYGLQHRQWMPPTETWLGITIDEIGRAKESPNTWETRRYPLLEHNMSRSDCRRWLQDHGYPIPVKSACVFCPYQSDARWKQLKEDHPDEFQQAVQIDRAIRNSTQSGVDRPAYLHRSLQPLDAVEFGNQIDLFDNECEGMCGL